MFAQKQILRRVRWDFNIFHLRSLTMRQKNLILINFALRLEKRANSFVIMRAHTNNLHKKMHYSWITHSNWHFSSISFVPSGFDLLLTHPLLNCQSQIIYSCNSTNSHLSVIATFFIPADSRYPGGGGTPYMKGGGMLVVSLRSVNVAFWSHLGCSGQNLLYLAIKASFRLHSKKY